MTGHHTGVSQTTLDRIVDELEDREWVERTPSGEYAATPTREQRMRQFGPFVESVAAIRRLGDAVSWLTSDELTVELRHFGDATVQRPDHGNPIEMV